MGKRIRLKRIRRRALVQAFREQEAEQSKPAKASNYLHHLADYYKQYPDMVAIIYLRESACMQDYNDNGKSHKRVLRKKLKKLNIPIVGCFYEVCSGKKLNEEREALINAVRKAKSYNNTVIIATSSDRFLRHKDYHSVENPNILPTEANYMQLKKLTDVIPLLTLLSPDMPPMEVRGYQTRWGQKTKGNKGGRPRKKVAGYKKIQREQKLGRVIRLHNKGKKRSEIAYKTGIKLGTINDWIVKYG
jgi:DNA invertase Pin-like site-specific DNA recombinase